MSKQSMQNTVAKFVFSILLTSLLQSCKQSNQNVLQDIDSSFEKFAERFLDAYWKQNPAASIAVGFGKYYELLKIPDRTAFESDVVFCKGYIDSLSAFNYEDLSSRNKIDYRILQNQLRSTIWYIDTFKNQEWDPSLYNITGECYEIVNRNFAPLDQRLRILSQKLKQSEKYYSAAISMINQPTREYTELAVLQNEGGQDVFGTALIDSINSSQLSSAEKDTLKQRVLKTTDAIENYTDSLKMLLANKSYPFRSFRIGKTLFDRKFKYDIVTDYSAEEIYLKAVQAKQSYHHEMFAIADQLWSNYCTNESKPDDSLELIKRVIDKISLHHVAPQAFVDTIRKQVRDLEHFIIDKNLFAYDTTYPLEVRIMPAYMSGVSLASASQAPPYEKNAPTYYNVSDLTTVSPERAESQLRENNDYMLSILSIHEAVPGHCLQGVYNSKSPDILKSVFANGAMVEGWAVYCERMMLENGWGNNSPELWLMFYKWSLRECCNVIIDYDLQCEELSKEAFFALLKNQAFQEDAQIEEKYHRATVSQVQLCSYFTGCYEIRALRDAYKNKTGEQFTLKNFHEKFLSYGSAPVKFISELMLESKDI